MTCLDISAGGEMICPPPDAVPWLTSPIPYTGFDLAVFVVVGLAFLCVGAALVLWGRR